MEEEEEVEAVEAVILEEKMVKMVEMETMEMMVNQEYQGKEVMVEISILLLQEMNFY